MSRQLNLGMSEAAWQALTVLARQTGDGDRVFRGSDEAAMETWMREFVDVETRVTYKGHAPSDVPPGRN